MLLLAVLAAAAAEIPAARAARPRELAARGRFR